MSIKKNYIYNILYNLLSVIIPFITTPYIARVLGPTGVGTYSYTYSIAYYFVLIAMMGLSKYGNRTIAAVRDDVEKLSRTFWEIYGMQLITGVISASVYIICITTLFKSNYILLVIQLLYVVSAIFDISWFFFGIEEFAFTVLRNVMVRIINVIMLFVFVKSADDVNIYCFIMSGSTLVSQIILWPELIKKHVKIRIPSIYGVFKHFKMNFILFIPAIAVSLYKIMDKIMLGSLINETEVGYYENAEKIINIPMMTITSIGTVMLPRMSFCVANKIKEKENYTDKTLMLTSWLSCGMAFGIMGIASTFIPFFLGNEFNDSVSLVIILAPTMIFISWGSNLCSQILIPRHKDQRYIVVVAIGAVINLILNSVLIPYKFSKGAAIATLITELIVFVGYIMCSSKYFQWDRHLKWLLIYGTCGFLMFLSLDEIEFPIQSKIEMIFLKIFIGGGIYVIISGIITRIFANDFFDFFVNQVMKVLKIKH